MEQQKVEQDSQQFEGAPDAFICPIECVVMKDPYMDDNGISYEKQAIFEWVKKNGTHPTARRQMKVQELKANLMLKDAIEKYKAQYKSRIRYQEERHKFEIFRLNFQAASKLQIGQLNNRTPGVEDYQKKEKILCLEQTLANKQRECQRIKKIAEVHYKKLGQKTLHLNLLQQEIKSFRKKQQKFAKERQQLNQKIYKLQAEKQSLKTDNENFRDNLGKNHALEVQKQSLDKKYNNLKAEIAEGKIQRDHLRRQLLNSEANLKSAKEKLVQFQNQRDKNGYAKQHGNKQSNSSDLLIKSPNITKKQQQLRKIKLIPDIKMTWPWQQKEWKLQKNVCIRNSDADPCYWLCSSSLPLDGEFVFTIKFIKATYSQIEIGVMQNEMKGEKYWDTYNHCVCLSPRAHRIRRPNHEKTNNQQIKCQCQLQLPKCPFQIDCHVDRQQGTIAWHYLGKQQAKSLMPKAWKTERNQLCAIVQLWKGDIVEML